MAKSVTEAFELFGLSDDDGSDEAPLQAYTEPSLQDKVTVCLSDEEQKSGVFNRTTVARATRCLRTHGIVIIPKAFPAHTIARLGDAALQDFAAARRALAARRAKPGGRRRADDDCVYRELCSRQAGRYEQRNGPALEAALQREAAAAAAGDTPPPPPQQQQQQQHQRAPITRHPGILAVLRQVCAAPGLATTAEAAADAGPAGSEGGGGGRAGGGGGRAGGGGGRAGGEDGGADDEDGLLARDVKVFLSTPGAGDQPLHADNDHLFWHTTLPPHVVTLFLPGLLHNAATGQQPCGDATGSAAAAASKGGSSDAADAAARELELVGWTAFLPGTHDIAAAAAALEAHHTGASSSSSSSSSGAAAAAAAAAANEIRPRLFAGDALLYDARLLHYGLANRSRRTDRPLLYVSFLRRWFQDRQNWGTERLFLDGGEGGGGGGEGGDSDGGGGEGGGDDEPAV